MYSETVMNDQDFAIVIGINAYPQLPPLRGAIQDALLFKNWLVRADGGGVPEDNIRLVLSPDSLAGNPINAKPGKGEIDEALQSLGIDAFLQNLASGNDDSDDGDDTPVRAIGRRLYFYFSGHGVGPTADEVAMLMANASLTRLNNNAGMRPYRLLLQKLALFEECVFIMDCCRDPVSGITPAEPAFNVPPAFTFGPCHPVEDFVIMAADWGSKALERRVSEAEEMSRLGVLTTHLIEGLQNPAAADADGRITSETLRQYLIGKMTNGQKPNFIAPSRREIVFRTIPTVQMPTTAVRILAPAHLPGHLVLSDGEFNEIDRRPANQLTPADAAWMVNLKKQLYSLAHVVNGQLVREVALNPRNLTSPHVTFPNIH